MTDAAIRVSGLSKGYGDHQAVDDVSFEVGMGEVVALLGPNGAGKTTTVEILEGHRDRDAGEVSVLGHDPRDGGRTMRERLGIVLQEAGIEEEFSVREILRIHRRMYPRRRDIDEVLALVGLTEKADARVKTLSGGQQRRVDMALGIIGDPELIFLDEPTTGFDPKARRQAWDVIDGFRVLGRSILLTTHYLDEAEHLADRVLVMAGGRLVADGTAAELRQRSGVLPALRFVLPADTDLDAVGAVGLHGEIAALDDQTTVEVLTSQPTADLARLSAWAVERGNELVGLELRQPDLEAVYLSLIDADDLAQAQAGAAAIADS